VPIHLAIALFSTLGVAACGITSSVVNAKMVEEVNGKLFDGTQFSPVIWYFTKRRALHREYQRLFPNGRLLFQQRLLTALGAGCLVAGIWALGFFAPVL
jgi:hypothetical protein